MMPVTQSPKWRPNTLAATNTIMNRPMIGPPQTIITNTPARRRKWMRWGVVAMVMVSLGTTALCLKGTGVKTRILCRVIPGYQQRLAPPEVAAGSPNDGATGIPLTASFCVNLRIPNGRLDPRTVTPLTVWLVRTHDQKPTDIAINLRNDGGKIEVKPREPLRSGTQYTLIFTAAIQDTFQRQLKPYLISFTTAGTSDPALRFEKISLPASAETGVTGVTIHPGDPGTLWSCSDDGRIFRFPILPGGNLAAPIISDALIKANNGPRVLTGFCFDPASTPAHPILWASHSWGSFTDVPDFSGKITRISGANLDLVEDVVVNLPRSVRDHMNNQPSFGPDGALYWPQPSNTAYGDPDPIWGMRPEHLLNASILRLDVHKATLGKPIDAKTADAGGTYNPFAPGAPLTIYAFGVRLAYDLLWHSNGQLYVPVNGSAAGGNTPSFKAIPGTALKDVPIDEDDWLFRIIPGKYYGHPNPVQGFFVLNGGNPTTGYDYGELPLYPVGTQPESNWDRSIYDFGRHVSANGAIEYKDVAFGGKLDKAILVCRYNFGSDIIVLHLDSNGNVVRDDVCIPGLGGLNSPLDLAEDPSNGNLYVSEYGARCITLLRAIPTQ